MAGEVLALRERARTAADLPGLQADPHAWLATADAHPPRCADANLSRGIATMRAGDTPGMLFERADQALCRAKRNGRNRSEA